jgi:hypothetical protein
LTDMSVTKNIPHTQGAHQTIGSALAAAQMQMGKALKSANNPHFKSKYADLTSVMDACLPALNAEGIAVIQPTTDDETGRYVETVLIHGATGESLKCRVPLIVAKNDMQGYGSAVTYARRYGLMSMAGIAPEDDDGNAAVAAAPKAEAKQKAEPKPEPAPATGVEVEDACKYLAGAQTVEALEASYKVLDDVVRKNPLVIGAAKARKAELTRPRDAADLDSIPY